MPKAYVIGHVTVTDPETYQQYGKLAEAALKLYGGRFLARGGRSNQVEGKGRRRNVILEFESYKTALEYYYSPEYQAAAKIRMECGECDMVVVEGI